MYLCGPRHFQLPDEPHHTVKDSLDNYVELKPVIQSFTVTNLGNNTVVPGTLAS